jgi:hypothetical protein
MDSGGLSDLNLSELQQYLGSMNFPADKQEVASNAESNDAPQSSLARGVKDNVRDEWAESQERR